LIARKHTLEQVKDEFEKLGVTIGIPTIRRDHRDDRYRRRTTVSTNVDPLEEVAGYDSVDNKISVVKLRIIMNRGVNLEDRGSTC